MRPLPDWYEKFRIMKEYGKIDFIKNEINKKLEKEKNNPFLYEFLGDIYMDEGNKDEAVEMYKKAKEIFKSQHEYKRAVVVLHKEKKINNNMENINEFADLLIKAGLKEKVKQYYIDVIKEFSANNKIDEIIEFFNKFIELYPQNLDLKIIMSKIFIMQNKVDKAKDMLFYELKKAEERRDIGAIEKINEVLDSLEAVNE